MAAAAAARCWAPPPRRRRARATRAARAEPCPARPSPAPPSARPRRHERPAPGTQCDDPRGAVPQRPRRAHAHAPSRWPPCALHRPWLSQRRWPPARVTHQRVTHVTHIAASHTCHTSTRHTTSARHTSSARHTLSARHKPSARHTRVTHQQCVTHQRGRTNLVRGRLGISRRLRARGVGGRLPASQARHTSTRHIGAPRRQARRAAPHSTHALSAAALASAAAFARAASAADCTHTEARVSHPQRHVTAATHAHSLQHRHGTATTNTRARTTTNYSHNITATCVRAHTTPRISRSAATHGHANRRDTHACARKSPPYQKLPSAPPPPLQPPVASPQPPPADGTTLRESMWHTGPHTHATRDPMTRSKRAQKQQTHARAACTNPHASGRTGAAAAPPPPPRSTPTTV